MFKSIRKKQNKNPLTQPLRITATESLKHDSWFSGNHEVLGTCHFLRYLNGPQEENLFFNSLVGTRVSKNQFFWKK